MYNPSKNKVKRVLAGACLLATLWNCDIATDRLFDKKEDTEVSNIYEHDHKKPQNLIITMAGYGDPYYQDLAETVGRLLNPTDLLSVDYGSEVNIEAIYAQTLQYIKTNNAKDISLYGVSMGGLVAIELGAKLINSGVNVSTIYLDSTPIGLESTTNKSRAGAVAVELVPFGRITRFIGEISIKLVEQHDGSFADKWIYAWHKSGSVPNSLIVSQSEFLRKGVSPEDVALINNGNVKIVYLRTNEATDDQMVNVDFSSNELDALFANYTVLTGDTGHAGTTHKEAEVAEMLAQYRALSELSK
jgi:hypothetical protein